MEKNLTSGSVLKSILFFSLPYLLSYFLQTLYGMADLFIIGQFEGVASTTAVSIGSQVMHMITVMIVGLAMGATVTIGRAVGAENKPRAARLIGNTVTLFMAGSVVLAAVLVGLVDPIVRIVSTPEQAVAGTRTYLIICFIGVPCITAYNIMASIFRGLGDSRSPMYFIAVACASNIALDYLFMGALHLGPAGAALGTTLSQLVSVIISLVVILRRKSGIHLSGADFKPERSALGEILSIGIPVMMQDGFIQPDRCRRRGHRGKDHQLFVPGAQLHAVHCIGTGRAEHRRRQARPCGCHSALRHRHWPDLWTDRGSSSAVHCTVGGAALHLGRGCGAGRCILYPGLYF